MTHTPQAANESRSRRNDVLFVLGLAVLTFAVYWPALHGGLLLDDEVMLNPTVQAPNGLYYIWCTSLLPDYFPLTYSSLWVEWHFWGTNLTGYHVTNVVLHIISALLLWRVLKFMRVPGARIAALLFAIHPVAVESVAWISERKNALAMPFFLGTILFYFKATRRDTYNTGSDGPVRTKYYVLSLLSFVLALLSKTAVVPLPFVLLLCDWWMGIEKKNAKAHLIRVVPFFALALVMGLVTVWFQTFRVIVGEAVSTANFPTRLAVASRAVGFYLAKLLWPANLTFIYPRWSLNIISFWTWLPLVGLIVAVGYLWWKRRGWARSVLVAFACFVVLLLPILGFVNVYFLKYSLVADHWQYFAMICPLVLIAAAIVTHLGHATRAGTVGCMMLAMIVLSWRHASVFRDGQVLWEDTLKKNPNCTLAHNDLGTWIAQRAITSARDNPSPKSAAQFERLMNEAMEHFRASIELDPLNVSARVNLADAFIALGRVDDAQHELEQAEKVNPRAAMAFVTLGHLLEQIGQMDAAEKQFQQALKVAPNYFAAHIGLGGLLKKEGKLNDAEVEYTKAVELQPTQAEPHRELADVLESEHKSKEAIAEYENSLLLDENDAKAQCHLGNLLLKNGRPDEAIGHLEAALVLQPDFAEAHSLLATVLEGRKQYSEAIAHYREAARLKPDFLPVLNNLAWLLATVPDAKLRNGAEALELASHAVALTKTNSPNQLDTLAAALAETGKFTQAADTAAQAIQLATASGDVKLQAEIQQRRQSYLDRRAIRQ